MQAILFGIMGLVLMLGLAKADKVNEKIIPFWEQISLSGNRAIEWLKVDGENGQFIPTCLNIKTLLKGDVKYFFKHFDFEHTMQHMKDLSLESEIMLLQCTNFDRWVLVVQKSAQKSLIKVLGIEWANENILSSEVSKLYVDEDGNSEVMEVQFIEPTNVCFTKAKEGKYYQYVLVENTD